MGISPGGRQDGHVSLSLHHPSSNGGETPIVRLEVTDRASRIVVLQVELSADQFLNLMGNRTAYGPASWTNHVDRIGLTMQHGSDTRPGSEYGNQMAADHHARLWAEVNGWTYWDAKRNNVGSWVFTGRRWVKPEPGQEPTGFLYEDQ